MVPTADSLQRPRHPTILAGWQAGRLGKFETRFGSAGQQPNLTFHAVACGLEQTSVTPFPAMQPECFLLRMRPFASLRTVCVKLYPTLRSWPEQALPSAGPLCRPRRYLSGTVQALPHFADRTTRGRLSRMPPDQNPVFGMGRLRN